MGSKGCPETSMTNYQSRLRKIPQVQDLIYGKQVPRQSAHLQTCDVSATSTRHARICIAEASNLSAQRYTTVQTAGKGQNRCTAGMDFTHLWLHVISLRYVTKGHSLASEGEGWVQSQDGECGQLTWQWTRFFSEDFGFSWPFIIPAKVLAQLPWQLVQRAHLRL